MAHLYDEGYKYCGFYLKCKDAEDCRRALTPSILNSARIWWDEFITGGDAPINKYTEKPKCHKIARKRVQEAKDSMGLFKGIEC